MLFAVKADRFDPAESSALAALLDDLSPKVSGALRAKFQARPEAARAFLSEFERGLDRSLARHARRHLLEAGLDNPSDDFRRHLLSGRPDLEIGSLLLARALRPNLDIESCPATLDRLAARARELFTDPMTARGRCLALNRVLYHEEGLRGDVISYEDPANSLIPAVLTRKKGLPLSLAVIYILVARRANFQLEPVGAPGHFMVGCFTEEETFFVDAFSGGRLIGEPELKAWLAAKGAQPGPNDLNPASPRDTLLRMCRNLARHCAGAGDAIGSALCADFLQAFATANPTTKH